MRFSFVPLVLLATTALASCDDSESDLRAELEHTEWLLAKTHRMVLRAKQHGRTHKERVFAKREKKYAAAVESLKQELDDDDDASMTIQPVPSNAPTSSEAVEPTVAKPVQTAHVDKPGPILAVSTSTSARTSRRPVPTPSASSSSKKGLGFERLVDLSPLAPSLSWAYNWNSHLFESGAPTMPPGVAFVPMLWKPDENHLPSWKRDVEYWRNQPQGLTHLLGFNEPDLEGQAEMTVEAVLEGWDKHMEPFARGDKPLKLVSPAVTNGPAPKGLAFLEAFMDGVKRRGMTVDAIALHWYDSPTNVEYFKNHLEEAHNRFGLPIWLTEYGFTSGSEQDKVDFHAKMVPWMNEQPWIERYAAFGDFVGTFVDDQGEPLPLGSAYASA